MPGSSIYTVFFRIKKKVPVLLLMLLMQNAHAQDNIQDIVDKYETFRQSNFQEKLYVHTDKNYYQAGEIIWFKVYNTDAVDNKPAAISKIAYVEILDSAHTPVLQGKVGLNQSTGEGSFYIPPNTVSGNFVFRAYTAWMKNFDPSYYFEKKITIVNIRKLPAKAPQNPASAYTISFFPEGGNIVNGLQNKIAFKAIDKSGKAYNFQGYLLSGNDTVLKFNPYKSGMGSFVFAPKTGEDYRAIIRPTGAQAFTAKLPSIFNQGYVIQLGEVDGNIRIVAATNVSPVTELYLIAHTRQTIKAALRAAVQNGTATFNLNRSQLGEGISQITLFNSRREPVCERLYYKEPATLLNINVATDQELYNKRMPVNVQINSSNVDTASLSMAVYKVDSLQAIDYADIAPYLYLTSDLGGYVENVNDYYHNKDKQATENLLLTNGWRRFDWNKVLQGGRPSFEFAPEYSGHIITGRIFHSITNQPGFNVFAYLSSPSLLTQFKTAAGKSDGSIIAEINNFFGGTHLIAQTNPLKDSMYRVEIDNPFSKKYSQTNIVPFLKPVNNPSTLLKQNIGMQVQNIYLAPQMNRMSYPSFTDTTAFYTTPDARYNLEDYTRFTTIEEILREYVPLVAVRRRGGEVNLPMINTVTNEFYSSNPVNLLDGVPVFNLNKFFEFDPLKIHKLELVAQRYVYGKSLFEGILNWKTYKPGIENYSLEPNALILDYPGLQLAREFYVPPYENAGQRNSRLPDFRNVLKWAPEIKMFKGGNYSENFYTSDLPGKYVIVVQGLDRSGLPGSAVKTFEVR